MNNLGERLFKLRRDKQLSQEEVADKLNVTRQTISKWETDQSMPDFDKVVPLCELYGITPDELFIELKGNKNSNNNELEEEKLKASKKAKGIAISVVLYFLGVVWTMISIPVMDMNPIVASAIFLLICGFSTAIIIYVCIKYKKHKTPKETINDKLRRQISSVVAIIFTIIYLIISFQTMAWHLTWIIWVIFGLFEEILKLIFIRGVIMMKNKKWIIALIVLLSIIMIAISIFFIGLLQNDFKLKGFRFGIQTSNELVLDKIYEEKFNNIVIDATTSEIFIKRNDTENIKVVIYGKKDYTSIETKLETLNIKITEKNCIGFCFNQKEAKVEIYLPKEYDGKIDIKNDYGNISIAEFLNANINVEEDCGDVLIVGGNIVKVDNYGDIEVEKANILTINEDCGDVLVSNTNDATIKNSYGDIKIKSVDNYLHLENDCGDIKLDDINLKKDSYIKDDYGDIEIGNTNELFIDAKTDLGKVKINNNYHKSDITLKIENDCGDIKVNN